MSWKRKAIIGNKKSEKKTIKTKSKMSAYCSINTIALEKDAGKREKSILEPSRGGIGMRLNIARARLVITIIEVIKYKLSDKEAFKPKKGMKRIIIPKIIAMNKFAKTPAAATAIVPHFLSLKLSGL